MEWVHEESVDCLTRLCRSVLMVEHNLSVDRRWPTPLTVLARGEILPAAGSTTRHPKNPAGNRGVPGSGAMAELARRNRRRPCLAVLGLEAWSASRVHILHCRHFSTALWPPGFKSVPSARPQRRRTTTTLSRNRGRRCRGRQGSILFEGDETVQSVSNATSPGAIIGGCPEERRQTSPA